MHYDLIRVRSDSDALQYADVTTASSISGYSITNVDWLSNLTSVVSLNLYASPLLTNIDGLSNLTSVGQLDLRDNQLTNVDGLSNLISAGGILLQRNQLTNVDGLSSLTSLSGSLVLYKNQLTSFDLPNLTVIDQGTLNAYSAFAVTANYDSVSSFASRVFSDDRGYQNTGKSLLEQMGYAHLLDNTSIITSAAEEVFPV